MALQMLHTIVENYVDKLLKVHQPKMSSMALKEEFLKQTEKFFPDYFTESYSAQFEEGGHISEVKLVVTPPDDDKLVTLEMFEKYVPGGVPRIIATVDQICNIA